MTTLSPIEQWVRKRSGAEDRRVTIADALIGGQWAAYNHYRLRFFAIRFLLNAVLHGINLAILVRIFDSPEEVGLVAAAYAVLGIARAAWWGGLEGLRERIRAMFADGRGHRADMEITRWLQPAIRAGIVLATVTVVVWLGYTIVQGPDAAVALLAVAFLLTAVKLPLRCYHSGLAAVRRIFRPLPVLILLDLTGLVFLLLLWPLVGVWAAPAASLVSGLLVALTTVIYTHRLYWFMGLNPGGRDSRPRSGPLGLGGEELLSGTASAAMSLDAVLLALISLGGSSTAELATIIVVVLPALAAGVDWANLFYFDLKRLGAAPFGQFRAQAAAQVNRLAWLIGAGTALVGMAIAAVVVPAADTATIVALGPLFVVRSLMAAAQVRAFTERAYGRVIAASLVVLAISIPAIFLDNDAVILLVLAAATIPGILMLRQAPTLGPGARPGLPWSLAEWLPEVASRRGPTLILVVHLDSYQHPLDPESAALGAARDQVAKLAEAHPHAIVTMIGATQIGLALTPGTPEEWVTREALVGGSAGLVAGLDVLSHDDGSDAVMALRDRFAAPGGMLAESLLETVGFDDDLTTTFDATFSGLVRAGLIGIPGTAGPAQELPGIQRQDVLSAAVHHATYGVPRAGGRLEVTTVTIDGAIARYYAVPVRVPRRVRVRWRATVIDAWFDVALRQQIPARR